MSIEAQVRAIQATAAAVVAQCDALLAAVAEPPAECRHERRVAAPRMGAADAWACPCGASGEE